MDILGTTQRGTLIEHVARETDGTYWLIWNTERGAAGRRQIERGEAHEKLAAIHGARDAARLMEHDRGTPAPTRYTDADGRRRRIARTSRAERMTLIQQRQITAMQRRLNALETQGKWTAAQTELPDRDEILAHLRVCWRQLRASIADAVQDSNWDRTIDGE